MASEIASETVVKIKRSKNEFTKNFKILQGFLFVHSRLGDLIRITLNLWKW